MNIVKKEDLELISQPLDFYGFNAYNGTIDYQPNPQGYSEYGY